METLSESYYNMSKEEKKECEEFSRKVWADRIDAQNRISAIVLELTEKYGHDIEGFHFYKKRDSCFGFHSVQMNGNAFIPPKYRTDL